MAGTRGKGDGLIVAAWQHSHSDAIGGFPHGTLRRVIRFSFADENCRRIGVFARSDKKENMMQKLAIAAFSALALTPAAALAGGMATPVAEPVVMAPVVVETRPNGDWTGAYGGLALGYGDLGSSGDVLNGDGILGGVFGGYRYDFGTWVGGIEGDWDTADIDLGEDLGSLDSVARIKLQAGADLGQVFLYATAGAAYADASVAGTDFSDWGYFGGVGMDYAVAENWLIGGEILAHQFDDFDDTGIDLDATTIKARVAYRF
jgi:opacity protein-like surface antigen